MGIPISTIKQFEESVVKADSKNSFDFFKKSKTYKSNYVIIIFANAYSDSRSFEVIKNNLHIMDELSDNVDFYLPGYSPTKKIYSTHSNQNTSIRCNNNNYRQIIYFPRLGDIVFDSEDFATFVMEITSRNKRFRYAGSCQMLMIPIENHHLDYENLEIYNFDSIIDCPSGPSLDFFIHSVFTLISEETTAKKRILTKIKSFFVRKPSVLQQINQLYKEATLKSEKDDSYIIKVVNNIIYDVEKKVRWSLKQEFYFISYSHQDIMKASFLQKLMESHGLYAWMAPDGIPQGRDYSDVVPNVIRLSKHFILLLSNNSANSKWVKRELDVAINNDTNTKVKILLVDGYTIQDMQSNSQLMFYLNTIQIRYDYDTITKGQGDFFNFIND